MDNLGSRISNTTVMLMIPTVLLFDLSQAGVSLLHFIPVVGNAIAAIGSGLINILAFLTFVLWFWIKGVKFFTSPKLPLMFGGGTIAELIPAINALPVWTGIVISTILIVRAEELAEKTAIGSATVKVIKMKQGKAGAGAGKLNPFKNTSRDLPKAT